MLIEGARDAYGSGLNISGDELIQSIRKFDNYGYPVIINSNESNKLEEKRFEGKRQKRRRKSERNRERNHKNTLQSLYMGRKVGLKINNVFGKKWCKMNFIKKGYYSAVVLHNSLFVNANKKIVNYSIMD